MSSQILGKVSCSPKGIWSSAIAYDYLDIVTNDNSAYISKKVVPTGTLITDTEYWQLLVSKGDDGEQGVGIANIVVSLDSTSGLQDTYELQITYTDGTFDDTNKFTVTNGNGISSITFKSSSGLVDTYTINFDNGDTTDFDVTNGNGIAEIELIDTSGLVKTYRITTDNGDVFDFYVTDGNGISSIEKTGSTGLQDVYTITYTNGNTDELIINNGNGIVSTEKISTVGLVDTYQINYSNGDTDTFTVTNGEKGNVMFCTFGIDTDTGELSVTYDDEYDGPTFSINSTTGELEVSIQ